MKKLVLIIISLMLVGCNIDQKIKHLYQMKDQLKNRSFEKKKQEEYKKDNTKNPYEAFETLGDFIQQTKSDRDQLLIAGVEFPDKINHLFKDFPTLVDGSDFYIIESKYSVEQYKSATSEKLIDIPQYTVVIEERNSNLVMTIKFSNDLRARSNYGEFDDTVVTDYDFAFETFKKINEHLFEGMSDHPEYRKYLENLENDIFSHRDGMYITSEIPSFGQWEMSYTLTSAIVNDRSVINYEYYKYDK